jgi:integrase
MIGNGRKTNFYECKNPKENENRETNQYGDRENPLHPPKNKVARHHWADDSITPDQLHQVMRACERNGEVLENKYAVITTGKLGMREGEAAHMQKKWIDFKEEVIRIPAHDPCDCNYCCGRWKQKLGRKGRTTIFSMEMVSKEQWTPKRPASIRTIPFGFDPEIGDILQDFFKKYQKWPYSVRAMCGRIRMLGKMVGILNLSPHPLRCTAATKFALDGMNAYVLMRVMGWDDIKMAMCYVNKAAIDIKQEFKKIYGMEKHDLKKDINYRVFYLTPTARKLLTRKRRPDEEEWLKHLFIPEEDSRT